MYLYGSTTAPLVLSLFRTLFHPLTVHAFRRRRIRPFAHLGSRSSSSWIYGGDNARCRTSTPLITDSQTRASVITKLTVTVQLSLFYIWNVGASKTMRLRSHFQQRRLSFWVNIRYMTFYYNNVRCWKRLLQYIFRFSGHWYRSGVLYNFQVCYKC